MASRRFRFARTPFFGLAILLMVSGIAAAEPQRLILPVVINEVPKGDALVLIEGTSIEVRVSDLERMGLAAPGGERTKRGADEWVAVDTIPEVTSRLDEENLVLRLQASPHLLGATVASLQSNGPGAINYATDPSAFVNYSLSTVAFDDPSISAEIGASSGNRFAYTTLTRSSGEEPVRGISQFVIDRPQKMQRLSFGDSRVATDLLGGSDLLGGVTYSRDFSLQPYFVRYPSFDFEGAAATPSTVEIYVNGVLTDRREVNPGEFRLERLPLISGSGNTRIVVRDAFGREQVYGSPYYYSTVNLGKGVSDFVYSLGFRRENFGSENFDYGDPAFVGFHRKGLTKNLTLGGRLEATEALVSGGMSMATSTRFGEIEALAAASDADGSNGTAGAFTYRYVARRATFGFSMRAFSDEYANLSLSPATDRPSIERVGFASYQLGRGSFGAQVSFAEARDRGEDNRVTLNGNFTLTNNVSLFASAGRSETNGEKFNEGFIGVSIFLGRIATANAGAFRRGNQTTVTADLQKPLPVGSGYGYRIQSRRDELDESASVSAQYQTRIGRYEVLVDPENADKTVVSASGGLVWIGNRFLPTRAVQQSYALARVGVPNVRVYASNLEVGRTDAHGDLLVANLLPYYGNRIRIEDQDVPLAYEVARVEELVAPPTRGGGLVQFPVRKIQTLVGSMRVSRNGEEMVPDYGQLTIEANGERWDSPIGRDGSFYFENAPPGRYDATVTHKSGICRFDLVVPEASEQMLKLGVLRCAMK